MKATNTEVREFDGKTYLVLTEGQECALTNHAEEKIKDMFSTWDTPDEFRKIISDSAEAMAVDMIERIENTPID